MPSLIDVIRSFMSGPDYVQPPEQTALEVNRFVESMRPGGSLADLVMREVADDALRAHYDPGVVLGILDAVAREAPSDYVIYLERMHGQKGWSEADRRILAAASDALEQVKKRAEVERQSEVLLRPSEAPESDSGSLLRPAGGPTMDDSGRLLRPADSDSV